MTKTTISDLIYQGDEDALRAALDANTRETNKTLLNQSTEDQISPLSLACKLGKLEIVKLLITAGSLVNLPFEQPEDQDVFYAIHYAIQGTCEEIVLELLRAGANLSITYEGQNVLNWAKNCYEAEEAKTQAMSNIIEILEETVNLLRTVRFHSDSASRLKPSVDALGRKTISTVGQADFRQNENVHALVTNTINRLEKTIIKGDMSKAVSLLPNVFCYFNESTEAQLSEIIVLGLTITDMFIKVSDFAKAEKEILEPFSIRLFPLLSTRQKIDLWVGMADRYAEVVEKHSYLPDEKLAVAAGLYRQILDEKNLTDTLSDEIKSKLNKMILREVARHRINQLFFNVFSTRSIDDSGKRTAPFNRSDLNACLTGLEPLIKELKPYGLLEVINVNSYICQALQAFGDDLHLISQKYIKQSLSEDEYPYMPHINKMIAEINGLYKIGLYGLAEQFYDKILKSKIKLTQTVDIEIKNAILNINELEEHSQGGQSSEFVFDCLKYQNELQRLREIYLTSTAETSDERLRELRKFNESVHELLRVIFTDCVHFCGKPPHEFAVMLVGSFACERAMLYSDVEFACIVEREEERKSTYMKTFWNVFITLMYSIGESDKTFRGCGFCFDSGDIAYLGDEIENEMLNTPQGLLQHFAMHLDQGEQAEFFAVQHPKLLFSSKKGKSLYDTYVEGMRKDFYTVRANEGLGEHKEHMRLGIDYYWQQIGRHFCKKEKAHKNKEKHDKRREEVLRLKDDYLAPLTLICYFLATYHGIFQIGESGVLSVWEVIDRLKEEEVLSLECLEEIRCALRDVMLIKLEKEVLRKKRDDGFCLPGVSKVGFVTLTKEEVFQIEKIKNATLRFWIYLTKERFQTGLPKGFDYVLEDFNVQLEQTSKDDESVPELSIMETVVCRKLKKKLTGLSHYQLFENLPPTWKDAYWNAIKVQLPRAVLRGDYTEGEEKGILYALGNYPNAYGERRLDSDWIDNWETLFDQEICEPVVQGRVEVTTLRSDLSVKKSYLNSRVVSQMFTEDLLLKDIPVDKFTKRPTFVLQGKAGGEKANMPIAEAVFFPKYPMLQISCDLFWQRITGLRRLSSLCRLYVPSSDEGYPVLFSEIIHGKELELDRSAFDYALKKMWAHIDTEYTKVSPEEREKPETLNKIRLSKSDPSKEKYTSAINDSVQFIEPKRKVSEFVRYIGDTLDKKTFNLSVITTLLLRQNHKYRLIAEEGFDLNGKKTVRLRHIQLGSFGAPAVVIKKKERLLYEKEIFQLKSFIYCLDQISQPINVDATEAFVKLNMSEIIKRWLSTIKLMSEAFCQYDDSRDCVFSTREEKKWSTASEAKARIFSTVCLNLTEGVLKELSSRMYNIRTCLVYYCAPDKKGRYSLLSLAARMEESFAPYLFSIWQKDHACYSVFDRFKSFIELCDKGMEIGEYHDGLIEMADARPGLSEPNFTDVMKKKQSVRRSTQVKPEKKFSLAKSIDEFKSAERCSAELRSKKERLENCEADYVFLKDESLGELVVSVVNTLNFKKMEDCVLIPHRKTPRVKQHQEAILNGLPNQIHKFTRLVLQDCGALTDKLLTKILENSTQQILQHLNVSGCRKLTQSIFKVIADNVGETLISLNVSGMTWENLAKTNHKFERLKRLIAKHCDRLKHLSIYAPQLDTLSIPDSRNLILPILGYYSQEKAFQAAIAQFFQRRIDRGTLLQFLSHPVRKKSTPIESAFRIIFGLELRDLADNWVRELFGKMMTYDLDPGQGSDSSALKVTYELVTSLKLLASPEFSDDLDLAYDVTSSEHLLSYFLALFILEIIFRPEFFSKFKHVPAEVFSSSEVCRHIKNHLLTLEAESGAKSDDLWCIVRDKHQSEEVDDRASYAMSCLSLLNFPKKKNLTQLCIPRAVLSHGYFVDCDFTGSDLSETSWAGANLARAKFDNCRLSGASFGCLYEWKCGTDPNESLWDVAFNDKTQEVACAIDNEIKVFSYDHKTYYKVGDQASDLSITALAWNLNGELASADSEGSIYFWNKTDKSSYRRIKGLNPVFSLSWSGGGDWLAAGDHKGSIWLYSTSGQTIKLPKSRAKFINDLSWHPNGDLLAASGKHKQIQVWNFKANKLAFTLNGHADVVSSVSWNCDGNYLLSTGDDKTFRLWDCSKKKQAEIYQYYDSSNKPNLARWHPSENCFALGSSDRSIRIFFIKQEDNNAFCRLRYSYSGHVASIKSLHWLGNHEAIISISEDKVVQVWDFAADRKMTLSQDDHNVLIHCVAISPSNCLLLIGYEKGWISARHLKDGHLERRILAHDDDVNALAWHQSQTIFASGGEDKIVKIWKVENGRQIRKFNRFNGPVLSLDWQYPGEDVISVTTDSGLISFCSVDARKQLSCCNFNAFCVYQMSWSSDGGMLFVVALGDNTVRVCQFENAKEIRQYTGHQSAVYCVAWNPMGSDIISAGADKSIHLWHFHDCETKIKFEGHSAAIRQLVWHDTGEWFVSAGDDATVRFWSHIGKETSPAIKVESAVDALAMANDDSIVVGSKKNLWVYIRGSKLDKTYTPSWSNIESRSELYCKALTLNDATGLAEYQTAFLNSKRGVCDMLRGENNVTPEERDDLFAIKTDKAVKRSASWSSFFSADKEKVPKSEHRLSC
jgi:WD40 repeat protein